MAKKKLIQIDKHWMDKELVSHLNEKIGEKISLRLYTIKPVSTIIDFLSLSKFLTKIIPHYVFSIKEIEDDIERELKRLVKAVHSSNKGMEEHELQEIIDAETARVKTETWSEKFNESRIFFKKSSEDYIGGKYGELLLFALVEGVLGCKMIAHKIRHLTNVNDEVKGSDGIFIGDYNNESSMLIGESKIMKSMSGAITDALDSINRYHNDDEKAHNLSHELLIARADIHKYDVDGVDIDELYDRLDPTQEAYKTQILVHPIILMYERKYMRDAQKNAKTHKEFQEMVSKELLKRVKNKKEVFKLIEKHVKEFDMEHAFLDFFLVPVDNVANFRNAMDDQLL